MPYRSRCLVRPLLALGKSNQYVKRERHQLETDVKRDQIVAAGDEHHAERGKENQRIVFAVLFSFDVQKASRNSDGEGRSYQKDCLEE
jgi:hypothetical protein